MEYEWDPVKANTNRRKHNVDFADAVTVFADERAITIPDDEHVEEDRYITIGADAQGRILVVVYTWRGNRIRLICTRKATRSQILSYMA